VRDPCDVLLNPCQKSLQCDQVITP
jgi:hypothetical protein